MKLKEVEGLFKKAKTASQLRDAVFYTYFFFITNSNTLNAGANLVCIKGFYNPF
jgi:hypothetical protein